MMVNVGIDQTTISMRPEYSQSGRYCARELECRNQYAKAKMATIVGTTMASIIAMESIKIVLSAAAIGPSGSRMFIGKSIPISHGPTYRSEEDITSALVVPPYPLGVAATTFC